MVDPGSGAGRRRIGRATGAPGVTVREWTGHGVADLLAGRGALAALESAIRASVSLELPAPGRSAAAAGLRFLRTGPLRWQVQAEAPRPGWIDALRAAAGGAASVVDQSDARRHFDVGGPRVRDALAKGLPLDLHPEAFGVGDVASTSVAHVTVGVRRLDGESAFRIGVPRSYAESWLEWLFASAAEFGCDVGP